VYHGTKSLTIWNIRRRALDLQLAHTSMYHIGCRSVQSWYRLAPTTNRGNRKKRANKRSVRTTQLNLGHAMRDFCLPNSFPHGKRVPILALRGTAPSIRTSQSRHHQPSHRNGVRQHTKASNFGNWTGQGIVCQPKPCRCKPFGSSGQIL
jgi:hypothetical protein